jgi:hypothetical protein
VVRTKLIGVALALLMLLAAVPPLALAEEPPPPEEGDMLDSVLDSLLLVPVGGLSYLVSMLPLLLP